MASGGRGVSPAFGSGKSGKPSLYSFSEFSAVGLLGNRIKSLITTNQGFVRNLLISSWTLLDSVYIGPVFVKPRSFELPNPDIECGSLSTKFYTWYFICCSWEFMHLSETSSENLASFVTVPFADNFKIKQFSTLIKGRCYFFGG
jgi:hypothetical protein